MAQAEDILESSELTNRIAAAKTLAQLQTVIVSGLAQMDEQDAKNYDLSGLPTFGGEAPQDCYGVWSWDVNSLLVGDGAVRDWRIVSRQEWGARP